MEEGDGEEEIMKRFASLTVLISTVVISLVATAQQRDDVITRAETPNESLYVCPDDMVEVEGDYCPVAQEDCLRWVCGDYTTGCEPNKKWPTSRCAEFRKPTKCLSKTLEHKHYCIDTYEYPNVKGQIPQSWMDWHDVKDACASRGKRMCSKSEWTFACEGPEMHPYPYGDGYHRDRTACNFDNTIPTDIDRFTDTREKRILDKFLTASGMMPRCVSPFGVHDQVGNVDELIVNIVGKEGGTEQPYISGLMGGHVFGVRNNCRAITDGHNEWFGWYETGGRCCVSQSN